MGSKGILEPTVWGVREYWSPGMGSKGILEPTV